MALTGLPEGGAAINEHRAIRMRQLILCGAMALR